MLDIKIAHLRMFAAVAEAGGISAAGSRLGRAAPAISMALKQLEETVGAPLFTSDRKTELTELGRHFLDVARAQLHGHERAMESVEAFAQAGRDLGIIQ